MRQYIYLVMFALIFTGCSTDDDSSDNIAPSSFSANTIDTRIDGATIEWTEAIDPDGDPVGYTIVLGDQEIASGGTTLRFSFSGLEAETNYEGYVEARDGNGGVSRANFFFTTESQVITLNISASFWEFSNVPEAGGRRIVFRAGFEVPFYENALRYQIEILNYEFNGNVVDGVIGETFIWDNDNLSGPVGYIDVSQVGNYGVVFNSASVNTIGSQFDSILASMESARGEAIVTIMLDD